jgi:hypothetical protein
LYASLGVRFPRQGGAITDMLIRAWNLDVDGSRHRVELTPWRLVGGAPRTFSVDDEEMRLVYVGSPWPSWIGRFLLAPHVATFGVASQEASLELTLRRPRYAHRLRIALRGLHPTSLVRIITGAAAGAVAAEAVARAMETWLLYSLTVGGVDRGTWVASLRGGALRGWTFVEPGARLPTSDDVTWPSLAEAGSERPSNQDPPLARRAK